MRNSSVSRPGSGRLQTPKASARGTLALAACATLCIEHPCPAQVAAVGFAAERFNPSAPGNSWSVMDELKLEGGLGAGVALVTGYSRYPVRASLPGNPRSLNVVSDQAFADVGLAIFFDRFRLTLDIPNPIYLTGQSGDLGATTFTAPSVDIAKYPDRVADMRLGVDTRIWGPIDGPLRLGVSTHLFIPSGERANYLTDNTYRGLLRILYAGNWGIVNHAGYVGVHLRPRDDSTTLTSPSLGGPRGSEIVFGLGIAPEATLASGSLDRIGLGPEIFGESAFKSAFGKSTTALEALLSAHYAHTNTHGAVFRLKLSVGRGLAAEFGAPTWRTVAGLEISDRIHN
jgi:hypothetical protein